MQITSQWTERRAPVQPIDQTTSGPATSVGERPLAGIRVVSVAVNLPGPLAAARLAEFGAEVVKIEPPTGDPLAALDALQQKGTGGGILNLEKRQYGRQHVRGDRLVDRDDVALPAISGELVVAGFNHG